MDTGQIQLCEYHRLDNGVHQFTWHNNDYDAVDEYIVHLMRIYGTVEPYLQRRIMNVATEVGLPAIKYVLRKMRDVDARFPDRLPNRMALVLSPAVKPLMLNALITLTTVRGKDTTRFFPVTKSDEAMNWLTQDS